MKKFFLKGLVIALGAITLGLFIYAPLAITYKKGYEKGITDGSKMMEQACRFMVETWEQKPQNPWEMRQFNLFREPDGTLFFKE